MTPVLSIITALLYLAAAITVYSRLFKAQGPNPKLFFSLGCAAIVCHCVLLSGLIFSQSQVNFSLFNVTSLVSLIIALSVTALSLRAKINLILPGVYTFAGSFLVITSLIPDTHALAIDPSKLILVLHISLALLAFGVLVISTLFAIQVNFINYKLKSKNINAVNHLPPLMQVEAQLFRLLITGVVLLIASQFLGGLFIDNFFAKDNLHKTVLSLVALALYVVSLWGHFQLGWRGHRIMILTIIATAILTLSYFGSRFVKEFLLS
ncbi:cytochrome C assembly family protein [Thalassotalea mangrovi]|uniref:Cytochrome C assembly family protein n=1 Tax=Thalassotalea mangrovi TaxID=2572245 RepID=A0A4V5NUL5_9GAMM|nr:cytochrome c biogenesis protein CcsA [Thalassotalea mangrovi]TKB46944.1 cytochrome C assembly family protein [Thalassotalea mangrovi]